MHTRTDIPVTPAPGLAPPSRFTTASPALGSWLPGLESLAPHTEEHLWLHGALLGPFSGDIVEYLALARTTGGPVLDLGSGAGRLTVPFARHGFTVEAVDRDAPSLARLHDWADRIGPHVRSRITTTHADLVHLRLRRRYRLILLAGAMIAAIPPHSRPGMLREIAAHLGADGALALDYTAHDAAGLAEDPHRAWAFQVPRFDGITEWVVARQLFDLATMSEQVTYFIERSGKTRVRRSIVTTDKWIVNQEDLLQELRAAGLRVTDQRQQRLDERTRSVLLVCHPTE
ncbi:class I SAM-dependent methyltransferase [Streptomyces chilikensis]|uniref:class I SAM-dependent methyltransferase n=1 Tax=Streptomyces chilikensis TaxID=1194079 RepID=UPI000A3DC192|nr:methyltransferase domain-containing protein [Streptomyces chilikensis]